MIISFGKNPDKFCEKSFVKSREIQVFSQVQRKSSPEKVKTQESQVHRKSSPKKVKSRESQVHRKSSPEKVKSRESHEQRKSSPQKVQRSPEKEMNQKNQRNQQSESQKIRKSESHWCYKHRCRFHFSLTCPSGRSLVRPAFFTQHSLLKKYALRTYKQFLLKKNKPNQHQTHGRGTGMPWTICKSVGTCPAEVLGSWKVPPGKCYDNRSESKSREQLKWCS